MGYSQTTTPSPGPGQRSSDPKRDPPPYSINDPPAYYISAQGQAQPPVERAVFVGRPGAGYRFLSSFAVASFIWVLLSMVAHTSVNALHSSHNRRQGYDEDYPIPNGENVVRCVGGNGWQNPSGSGDGSSSFQGSFATSSFSATGQASFTLPISSAALFFVSRGVNLGGAIDVVTSPNQAANSATVQVVVSSTNENALGSTRACLLTRRQGENGVGVFTPSNSGSFSGNWNSNFHITVVLPDVGGGSPLQIRDFETDLPNSSQQIGDLSRKVLFSRLSLAGSNGPISAKSVNTNFGKIGTTDAAITGSFNTTNILTLSTSNGPINADVGLTNTGRNISPSLSASTSNGPLTARISLISTSGSRGSFSVKARTSNQRLQLSFPTSPAGSQLDLVASTSNSPASVTLHPLYTGGFNLQTSGFQDATANNAHPELTERQVHLSNVGRGSTSGEVFWQEGPNANGMVSVSTTNGNVMLNV